MISLVLATVSRTGTLGRLLDSLASQTHSDFELIVVDQNPDDRLVPLLAPYAGRLTIRRLRSPPGLSRARNVGLAAAGGDVIAFPDDDCWYAPDVLERVTKFLADRGDCDGLTCRAVDEAGKPCVVRWDKSAGPIHRLNVWRRACSITMFLRRRLIERVGGFDEQLGAGAAGRWGSGEETDYLLRALAAGCRLTYEPSLAVRHPNPVIDYAARASRERARSYGAGMGRLLRVHRLPLRFKLATAARPLAGAILSLAALRTAKARYHWCVFAGRLAGWLGRQA